MSSTREVQGELGPVKNQIICSAIKTPGGRLYRGHRHGNCFLAAKSELTAAGMTEDEAYSVIRKSAQGFMDANNEYVTRYRAQEIQLAAGISSKNPLGYIGNQLYSEDLYLVIDFVIAHKAHLPFISIHTDDPVHVRDVLRHLTGKTVMPLPTVKSVDVGDTYLWWTEDPKQVTTDNYKKLCDTTATCVVINPDKPSPLVYDSGVLPTPLVFYENYLKEMGFDSDASIGQIVQQLKGLSLKTAQQVVQLTMARVQSIAPQEIRKTRQMMGGETPGLSQLDTHYDFYEWPYELRGWLDLNDSYFLDPATPPPLVPRGLLLVGEGGVGKSMGARVLAKHWDVPLFRLDVAATMNRYLGTSEGRIATNLQLIEQNAPCVWLMDEVEKLFQTGGDEGTTQRILSQMLWWLQEHKSRVLTVMTTNDITAIPKELYRAERLDKVITLEKLSLSAAKMFARKVYESVVGYQSVPLSRQKVWRDALDQGDKGMYAHAEVRVLVHELIKKHGWLKESLDKPSS